MSKKARIGGFVQISRKRYEVIQGPLRDGDWYRLLVRPTDGGPSKWAQSEHWRSGCGPWKLTRTPPFVQKPTT